MTAHRHPPSSWQCTLLVICLSAIISSLWALEMGPGMFLVQDVPPGREVNLHRLGGVRFTVYNRTDQVMDYSLRCQRPVEGGLASWEKGYEEIPNAAWCYLEESSITIPAKSERQVGLIINIPDEPENWNRKFMLAVTLRGGKDAGLSVGLAVACRVQIETAVNDRLGSATGAPLATVPGTIVMSGRPGARVSGPVLVRNNTGGRLEAAIERLPAVEPDPIKHPRYFSNGFRRQDAPWFAAPTSAFALEAGAGQLLPFAGTIPATAAVGTNYEELAFIRATAADGKELMTFVRLHCLVEAPAPPTAGAIKDQPTLPTPVPETPVKP